jgi:sulfate transport system ATP-binding protein
VLLLDEPFSALDAKVRKELRAWLRNLHDEMHVTTVIVTHDQEEAMEVADRIVVMNEGRIEQIGSPAEIYDQPATPFVMSFVGAVNVLPRQALPASAIAAASPDSLAGAQSPPGNGANNDSLFIRPHDIEIFVSEQPGTVPASLRRLIHMGRDIQAELVLEGEEVVIALLPRDQSNLGALRPGDRLYVASRQARSFVPDYAI